MLTMTDAGLLLPCRRGADGEATFRMPPLAPRITVAHDYCLQVFLCLLQNGAWTYSVEMLWSCSRKNKQNGCNVFPIFCGL